MASHYEAPIRKPLVLGDKGYHDVSVDIAAPVEGRANRQWWIVFTIALVALLALTTVLAGTDYHAQLFDFLRC